MKYKSFSVTLRPSGGVTQDDIDMFMTFTERYAKYYYVITEKSSDERHIHAALYMNKERTTSAFNQQLKRIFQYSFQERGSIWKHAMSSHNMYNDDFYLKYLKEANEEDGDKADDDSVVIGNHVPPEEERWEYYQDTEPRKATRTSGDPYFLKLEKLYYEYNPARDMTLPESQPTLQQLESFMCRMMYKERRLKVVTDSRKLRRLIKCLQQFIQKCCGTYCWEKGDVKSEMLDVHMPWAQNV